MKRFVCSIVLLLASALAVVAQEHEYIQVDWYPLLTDSVGWNITSGGLAFGFVDGISQEADVKMESSFEISWLNVIGAKYNTGHGQRISVGLGIDWKNYKLKSTQRFVVNEAGVSVSTYPDAATHRKSRVKVFALELPILFRQRIFSHFDLLVGEVTNFNVHASVLTTYVCDNKKVRQCVTKGLHRSPVTFDLIAGVNYRKIGAYVRYSPCRVFKKGYGPMLQTLSVGVALGL